MKTFLFLPLFIFLVASCAKNTPPVAIPIPPQKTESAQPSLRNTQRDIDTSYEENVRIGEQVNSQGDLIEDQKESIIEALAKVGVIRKMLENADVNELAEILKNIKIRNDELQRKNENLTDRVTEQNKALTDAKKNAQETMTKLTKKENEAVELRKQNKFLSDNLQVKNNEAERLKQKLATAQVYRRLVFGIVIFIVIGIVATIAIKIIKPF